MTAYNYSLSVIVPAEQADTLRRMLWALGRDTAELTSFPCQVSKDGNLPVTGYGLHAMVDDVFISTLDAAHDGSLPDVPWASVGIDADSVITAIQSSTIIYLKNGDVSQTWPDALGKAGVMPVEELDEP